MTLAEQLQRANNKHETYMHPDAMFKTQSETVSYYQRTGWQITRSKLAPVIIASRQLLTGKITLKIWTNTARVPAAEYIFPNAAQAESYVVSTVRKLQEQATRKATARAAKSSAMASLKASDHWNVGDVVYTSWGYDQTNVDWFQITALKPKSVIVRQIPGNSSDHGGPSGGKTAPRRFEFIGPEIRCPLSSGGYFSAGPCGSNGRPHYRHLCHLWKGSAVYTSSYA